MPRISRRQFWQFAASALATLGLNQLDLQRQGDRYRKVLAQSTPRRTRRVDTRLHVCGCQASGREFVEPQRYRYSRVDAEILPTDAG